MPRIAREGARFRVYRQARRTWTRAAIRRARRCRRQGETIEAGDLLAPMCHRYTYEFDTVDLAEARRLPFTTGNSAANERDIRIPAHEFSPPREV